MRFRDTGTRLRGVTVPGEYNNPSSIDWTEGTLSKLDMPCEFQPLPGKLFSQEDVVQQDRTVTHWLVFLPAGADITTLDRWRFAGVDYEVNGGIERLRIRGSEHHVQLRVQRVTGG